jgi:hypothetical protein
VTSYLNPARQARRALAIDAALDARETGDEDAHRRALEQLGDLNRRLHDEQLAELGYMPPTEEGRRAVLEVADRIRAFEVLRSTSHLFGTAETGWEAACAA